MPSKFPKSWTQKDEIEEVLSTKVLVEPSGPVDSKILIISDYPEKSDVLKRIPLLGYNGFVFTDCCKTAKINRYDCRITTVYKHKPFRGNVEDYYYDTKQLNPKLSLQYLWTILAAEIEETKPNVIICLGRESIYAVCRLPSIFKYRGSILTSKLIKGYKVIPALHPESIKKQYELKTLLELDLTKAKRESLYPDIRLPVRKFITKPSLYEIKAYIDAVKVAGIVSIDIEVDMFRHQIDCVALSIDKTNAICIPLFLTGKSIEDKLHENPSIDAINLWTPDEEGQIWRWLTEIIESPTIKKIAQNGLFDFTYFAKKHGIIVRNFWHDTMLSHHNCYAEMPKDLGFLVSIYTDEPYFKGSAKSDRWTYNCKDASCTKECADELLNEVEDLGVNRGFKFDMLMIEPLMFIQLQGLRVNQKLRSDLIIKYRNLYGFDMGTGTKKTHIVGTEEQKFWNKIGKDINVLSSTQLQAYLYSERGFNIQLSRKSGNPTADKTALMKLYYQTGDPMLKEIIELRGMKGFLSNTLMAKLDPTTGNLHCGFNWTESFRLTSSQSCFENGRNLQNLPHNDARRMIIPPLGMEFGAADLSGAEAHVVAHMIKDEYILDLFAQEKKIHKYRAAIMYDLKPEDIEKGTDRYNAAKAGVHAVHYDVGIMTFLDILNKGRDKPLNFNEGKYIFNLIKEKIPTALRYQEYIQNMLKEQGMTLWNFLGRRRTFYGRYSPQLLREAYAWIPQSTVPDVVNIALQKVYYNYRKYVNIQMQIHDELLFAYYPKHRKIAHEIVHEAMTVELTFKERKMTMGVEHTFGDNWLEMEDYKI